MKKNKHVISFIVIGVICALAGVGAITASDYFAKIINSNLHSQYALGYSDGHRNGFEEGKHHKGDKFIPYSRKSSLCTCGPDGCKCEEPCKCNKFLDDKPTGEKPIGDR